MDDIDNESLLGSSLNSPTREQQIVDSLSQKPLMAINNGEGFFESAGLTAEIKKYPFDRNFVINSNRIIQVKQGDLVAHMDFLPLNRARFSQENLLFATAMGAKGIDDFLHHVYDENLPANQRLPYIKYFEGESNLRMAIAAKKLGMEYQNEDDHKLQLKAIEQRFQDGRISDIQHEIERDDYLDQTQVSIIGELGKVREKFLEMEKNNTIPKLLERARREAQNPNKGSE